MKEEQEEWEGKYGRGILNSEFRIQNCLGVDLSDCRKYFQDAGGCVGGVGNLYGRLPQGEKYFTLVYYINKKQSSSVFGDLLC